MQRTEFMSHSLSQWLVARHIEEMVTSKIKGRYMCDGEREGTHKREKVDAGIHIL